MIPVATDNWKISSPFGAHRGLDFAVPIGTVVVAPVDGVVETVKTLSTARNPKGSYGRYVVVRDAQGNRYFFAHLSSFHVSQGQKVRAGAVVGLSGESGNASGPHLHFEIRDASGAQVDPTPLLKDGKVPEGYNVKGYVKPTEQVLRAVAPQAKDWGQFDPAGFQKAANDALGAEFDLTTTMKSSMLRLQQTLDEAQGVLEPTEEVDEYGI